MVTEQTCKLSEYRVDLPRKKGSGTSRASSEEHLPNNAHRKDLSWPYFDDEPIVQEKQQVKHQQSCIFVFVACVTTPSSN